MGPSLENYSLSADKNVQQGFTIDRLQCYGKERKKSSNSLAQQSKINHQNLIAHS